MCDKCKNVYSKLIYIIIYNVHNKHKVSQNLMKTSYATTLHYHKCKLYHCVSPTNSTLSYTIYANSTKLRNKINHF